MREIKFLSQTIADLQTRSASLKDKLVDFGKREREIEDTCEAARELHKRVEREWERERERLVGAG